MIFIRLILIGFLFFVSVKLLAQCDSSFFYFKRAIIGKISANLQLDLKLKIPEKTIKLEFSDYQRFVYTTSDPKSTLGFACVRNETCNNYSDSLCINNRWDKTSLSFERTLFENFMSSDDLKICDSIKYLHTLAKVIEKPIDGWGVLESYYFRFVNNNDLKEFYKNKRVYLTVPVYILLDKRLKQTRFYTVKIDGTQMNSISIEKKQIVINE